MRFSLPSEKTLALLMLEVIVIFSIFEIAVPFSKNSLQDNDLPGHLQAAAYVHDVLWPSPLGWDYRSYGGYPLNQFYGPFFAWLVALFGFVVPLELAFKGLLLLAVLATPLCVYYCARKWGFQPLPSAIIALMVLTLLYAGHVMALGSDFNSIFNYGNVTNGFALPLFFLYIGRLNRDVKNGSYLWPTILLSLVSLAHLALGLAAWLFMASYLVSNRSHIRSLAKHALISGLIIAFWLLPMAANLSYSSPESGIVGTVPLTLEVLSLLEVALVAAAYTLLKRDRSLTPHIIFFAAIMVAFVIGAVVVHPAQLNRIFLPAIAISFFFPMRALTVSKKSKYLIIPVLLALLTLSFSTQAIGFQGPKPISLQNFGPVDGRIMVTFYQPSVNTLNELVPAATGNIVANGVFTESTPNAQFYRFIEQGLNSNRWVFNLSDQFDNFGINWLLDNNPKGLKYTEKIPLGSYYGYNLSLFRIAKSPLAEVLEYQPQRIYGNWKAASYKWFESQSHKIVVVSQDPIPNATGTGQEKVEFQGVSNDRIRIYVNATSPVPVFLKFSYFPNWKAYVNGEPAQIYQVLPAFMLVYGYGNIELRYEQLPVDTLGWILSAVGLVWLIVDSLMRRKSRKAPITKQERPKDSKLKTRPSARKKQFTIRFYIPSEKLVAQLILEVIIIFSIFYIAIPFSKNSLQNVDLPGHLQAAAYVHDVLWPSPLGWDYRFFGGYPLHQFYGLLFSWLAALLGFLVQIDIAFKALVIVAILATPLAVYYCARSFSFPPLYSSVLSLMAFATLYAIHGLSLGSDFYGVLNYGFVAMGLLTPLTFLYIGRLNRDLKTESYIIPSILLAAISLTHIFVGLTAWIFLAGCLILSGRPRLKYFVKHIALTALLVAFWALPLLAKISYNAHETGIVNFITLGLQAILIFAVVGLSIVYLLIFKKEHSMTPLIIFFSLTMLAFIVGMIVRPILPINRFFIIATMIGFFFPIRAIQTTKKKHYLIVPILLATLAIFSNITSATYYGGPKPINITDFGLVDARIITTSYTPSTHTVGQLIPAATGNIVANGLYVESALNGHFYRLIEDELKAGASSNRTNLRAHLDIFGINWLLASDPRGISYTAEKVNATSYNGRNISLFRVAKTDLAEVLRYEPQTTHGNWKNASLEWFGGPNAGRVVAYTEDALPQAVGTGQEKVEFQGVSNDRIRIYVNATSPVPVFLKFSYFPNWKAYVNGEPAQIYQVLPAFMLVYGYGNIELRYEQLPVDTLGWVLSALGAVWVLVVCFSRFRDKSPFKIFKAAKAIRK